MLSYASFGLKGSQGPWATTPGSWILAYLYTNEVCCVYNCNDIRMYLERSNVNKNRTRHKTSYTQNVYQAALPSQLFLGRWIDNSTAIGLSTPIDLLDLWHSPVFYAFCVIPSNMRFYMRTFCWPLTINVSPAEEWFTCTSIYPQTIWVLRSIIYKFANIHGTPNASIIVL